MVKFGLVFCQIILDLKAGLRQVSHLSQPESKETFHWRKTCHILRNKLRKDELRWDADASVFKCSKTQGQSL